MSISSQVTFDSLARNWIEEFCRDNKIDISNPDKWYKVEDFFKEVVYHYFNDQKTMDEWISNKIEDERSSIESTSYDEGYDEGKRDGWDEGYDEGVREYKNKHHEEAKLK